MNQRTVSRWDEEIQDTDISSSPLAYPECPPAQAEHRPYLQVQTSSHDDEDD